MHLVLGRQPVLSRSMVVIGFVIFLHQLTFLWVVLFYSHFWCHWWFLSTVILEVVSVASGYFSGGISTGSILPFGRMVLYGFKWFMHVELVYCLRLVPQKRNDKKKPQIRNRNLEHLKSPTWLLLVTYIFWIWPLHSVSVLINSIPRCQWVQTNLHNYKVKFKGNWC